MTYKAKARGVNVGFVNRRYTSQNIANMDILSKGIARLSLSFGARGVGLSVTLDYNTAMNIREDFLKLLKIIPLSYCHLEWRIHCENR